MSSSLGRSRQITTVDIDKELYQRVKDKANSKRYTIKEYVNEVLKMLLDKEEFLQNIAPYLSVSGYHENTVSLIDSQKKELYDVWMKNWRLWCEKDKKTDCIHTWYVWAIPELAHLNIARPAKQEGKKKLDELLVLA